VLRREPFRTFVVAAVVGLVVAVSPFMPQEWFVKLGGGLLGAALVVVWRFRSGAVSEAADAVPIGVPAGQVPARVWLVLCLVAVCFAPTAYFFYEKWTGAIWQNGHGLFMPFLMFFLGRAALRRDPDPERPESSAWGFLFVVPALLLALTDWVLDTQYLSAVAFVMMLPGLSLLFLGLRRTRALALPLLLGIFMIPIPNTVATHLYLKTWTAEAVEPLIRWSGVPILREDTLLMLPHDTFMVADACSGFSALYAAVGLSIILARFCRSNWRRAFIIVAAWPLALLCNTLRVYLLVMMAHLFGTGVLDTALHGASGVATFWLVLLALFMVADRETLRTALA
jgi:exosortase